MKGRLQGRVAVRPTDRWVGVAKRSVVPGLEKGGTHNWVCIEEGAFADGFVPRAWKKLPAALVAIMVFCIGKWVG